MLRLLTILLCLAPALATAATDNKDAVAVIIGNKTYQHHDVPEVSFAHRDADAIKRYVIDILGYRERNVIDLRDATQAKIEGAFGNERSHKGALWRTYREGRSDIVVYYSGHGMPGLSDGKGYLLPSDVAPTDAEIGGYPLEVLYANLQKLKARSVLVLLDACFSGASHGGSLVPAGSGITLAPKGAPAPPRGLTVLTAAGSDQIASWDLKAEHGLFTEHFLRAVYGAADDKEAGGNGDGRVTVAEVKAHLDEEMTYVAKRTFGREQVATVAGSTGRVLSAFPIMDPPKRPATHFKDCDVCPEMVVVPSGSFMMGSKSRFDDEMPSHRVTISRPFAVGKYEVTFAEWDACIAGGGCGGYRPKDGGWGRDDRPVINVNWNDVQSYVKWLSRKTGSRYRLLSEAEWEYVARAGSTTVYPWGSQASRDHANYGHDDCCVGHSEGADRWVNTSPVGSFEGNPFGLHDLLGNVWEWVEDCWHGSYVGAPENGSAWTTGGDCRSRIMRGGAWQSFPRFLRSALRQKIGLGIGSRSSKYGFRIARTPSP